MWRIFLLADLSKVLISQPVGLNSRPTLGYWNTVAYGFSGSSSHVHFKDILLVNEWWWWELYSLLKVAVNTLHSVLHGTDVHCSYFVEFCEHRLCCANRVALRKYRGQFLCFRSQQKIPGNSWPLSTWFLRRAFSHCPALSLSQLSQAQISIRFIHGITITS